WTEVQVRGGRMQPRIAFCNRCRGMRLGWNKRYIFHRLSCTQLHGYSRVGGAAIISAALIFCFPNLSSSVFSAQRSEQTVKEANTPAGVQATVTPVAAEVRVMDAFLERHQVDKGNRIRLAESIVASAGKYDLNPRLLASVMIVESRGN